MIHLIYFEDNSMNYLAVVNYFTERYFVFAHDVSDSEVKEYAQKFEAGDDFFIDCEREFEGDWLSLSSSIVSFKVLV